MWWFFGRKGRGEVMKGNVRQKVSSAVEICTGDGVSDAVLISWDVQYSHINICFDACRDSIFDDIVEFRSAM
jgi:hypothetical protein